MSMLVKSSKPSMKHQYMFMRIGYVLHCSCTHGSVSTFSNAASVLVITPLRGMLLVYRPETRGPINRNIPIRGVIIDL